MYFDHAQWASSVPIIFCKSYYFCPYHNSQPHTQQSVLLIYFQAAEKKQKEIVRQLVELDSSLVKVKDKNGRMPADLVPSNELEILDMLKA